MQKLTRYKTYSLAVMMLALLLCAAHSAFAYERLFTHSHGPLSYHQHYDDHFHDHHSDAHHSHDHHQHSDGVPLTNENLPSHLVSPANALTSTKIITASNAAVYPPLLSLAAFRTVPAAHYRPPIPTNEFRPPTKHWLIASLTLAPNSPPTV